jgi:hypothetical protein
MYLLSAACGTYVIILDVIIISEQNVIIFILRLSVSFDVSLLKKNYIPLLIYNSDVSNVTWKSKNFHLHFLQKRGVTEWYQSG